MKKTKMLVPILASALLPFSVTMPVLAAEGEAVEVEEVVEEEAVEAEDSSALLAVLDAYGLTTEDIQFVANILKQYNEGQTNLGLVDEDYYGLELKLAKMGADTGNGDLALWVGEIYQGGHVEGLSEAESVQEAVNWWEKAASLGVARGLTNIGLLYEHSSVPGGGELFGDIEVDMEKAAEYLIQADELGDMKAPRYLGFLYESTEDYESALTYFLKAADSGDISAQYYAGQYYLEGKGTDVDYEKALSYLNEAASSEKVVPGVANAQYSMGQIFENGYGVDVDVETAKQWYETAAENGSEEAAAALENLQ